MPSVFYFLFSNYRHIARTTGQQNACLRGGSKADNIIACIGMDAYEGALKRKGARPIMNDRLTKDYIDLDSRAKGLEGVGRVGVEV